VAASGAHPIVLLDRNPGSGIKLATSLYYLNYPTGLATGSYSVPVSVKFASTLSRYVKVSTLQGSGGSGYEDVMDQSAGNLVSDLVSAQANGDYAIGTVSAETAPISSSNAWDFTAINNVTIDSVGNINGSASSYSNVIRGAYEFYYQLSFNTRAGFLSAATPNAVLANAFVTEVNVPAFAGIVSHVAFPAAVNGIVIDGDKAASFGAGVTTGSRKGTSEAPLSTFYDATNPVSSTISANSDPL
jgi:hypothetical protein